MDNYIEHRPEAIEAIKKSISHWDLICMGCDGNITSGNCELCCHHFFCIECGLSINKNNCNSDTSTWWAYRRSFGYKIYCRLGCFCTKESAEEAEAMLEALVQLLPPKHRTEFGG